MKKNNIKTMDDGEKVSKTTPILKPVEGYLQFFEACRDESANKIIIADLPILGDTVEQLTDNIKIALSNGKEIITATGITIRISEKDAFEESNGFRF